MNTTIRDDFANFVNNNELFNSTVQLYDSQGGTLIFEGNCIYDKKPNPTVNEDGMVAYSGHKSIMTISRVDSINYDLKGYYAVITDNEGTKNYWISQSLLTSNAGSIICYLKETKVEV